VVIWESSLSNWIDEVGVRVSVFTDSLDTYIVIQMNSWSVMSFFYSRNVVNKPYIFRNMFQCINNASAGLWLLNGTVIYGPDSIIL
jgi:hypothetical protein